MRTLQAGVLTALIGLGSACGGEPVSVAAAEIREVLSPYGLGVEATSAQAVVLAWQAPAADCPHVYRLSVGYDVQPMHETDSVSSLVVGLHPRDVDTPPAPGPIPEGTTVAGQIFYQGVRAERVGATRDIHLGRNFTGPAAPTAACYAQTWDPMEDAMALGWPRLPGRLTAVGETWTGIRVEGRCNRSACIDLKTGGGGPDNHHLPCATPSWSETLAGVFEVGDQRVAVIDSQWSDGHEREGIWTQRRSVVSIDHGRPVWSQTVVHHTFPQPTKGQGYQPIERTWTLEAADECPGSLRALGWQRPEDVAAEADRMLAAFADSEQQRRRAAKQRRAKARAQDKRNAPPPGKDPAP